MQKQRRTSFILQNTAPQYLYVSTNCDV